MKDIREEMNISLQEISLVWLIHLKRLLRDLDKAAGIVASQYDGYNRGVPQPCRAYPTTSLDTNSFKIVLQILFLFPFSRPNFKSDK